MKAVQEYIKVSKQWTTWSHLLDENDQPLCRQEKDNELRIVDIDLEKDDPNLICNKCAAVLYRFKVETLQYGQPRPYADSTYVYHVTDEAEMPREYEDVKAFCKRFVKFSYDRDDMPGWHSPRFLGLSKIHDGIWKYRVSLAFTG